MFFSGFFKKFFLENLILSFSKFEIPISVIGYCKSSLRSCNSYSTKHFTNITITNYIFLNNYILSIYSEDLSMAT